MPTNTNKIYIVTDWIMKLIVINVIWILFNLPLIFVLVNILFIEKIEDIFTFVFPVFICLPFIFFPSTTAMFASVRDYVLKKRLAKSIFSRFWIHYKSNYRKSLLGGFVLSIFWVVLIVDILLFLGESNILIVLFMIVSVLLFVFTVNFFSVVVHVENTFFTTLKNASLITISSPLLMLIITIGSMIILYLSIYWFHFLLLLCTGSLITLLSFYMFYLFYTKVISPSD